MARLVLPSVKYKDSFLDSLRERQNEKLTGIINRYVESIGTRANLIPSLQNNFTHFINFLKHNRNLPPGSEYPAQTTYWLVDKNEYIGTTSIRHWLTPLFQSKGGHIGYVIRPSKRNQGYGKKILELSLKKAQMLNLTKVLLTVSANNAFSQKIIEANGGLIEPYKSHHYPQKKYYWIDIKSK